MKIKCKMSVYWASYKLKNCWLNKLLHISFPGSVPSSGVGGSFPCSLNTFCLLFKRSAHLGFRLNFLTPFVKSFFHKLGAVMSGCHAIRCTRRLSTFLPHMSQIPGFFTFLNVLILSTNFAYASFP